MADIFSDHDIELLLKEIKPLPEDYRSKIQIRPKRGHKERELDVQGVNGSDFRLILRQSLINPIDFSVILAYRPPNSNQLFRLRRYNGKSHEHTNTIEEETFYDFHIHGAREDTYAVASNRFSEFHQAIVCIIEDCAFEVPPNTQRSLFEGV
jgi:hypothetical protein